MSENVNSEFLRLTSRLNHLVTLHLTFRRMPSSALHLLGEHCPGIEVIKLIGYCINSPAAPSETSNPADEKPDPRFFRKLRVLEVRIVRSEQSLNDYNPQMIFYDDTDDADDAAMPGNTSPISRSIILYFLTYSFSIQDITISAMMHFLDEKFLMEIFESNPMIELQRLCLSPLNSTCSTLTSKVAMNVIMSLPNLHTMALSRWKMTSREMRRLREELKRGNFDVNLI